MYKIRRTIPSNLSVTTLPCRPRPALIRRASFHPPPRVAEGDLTFLARAREGDASFHLPPRFAEGDLTFLLARVKVKKRKKRGSLRLEEEVVFRARRIIRSRTEFPHAQSPIFPTESCASRVVE